MVYERFRELRENCDVKQEAIAKVLGVKQGTYSKYELGKIDIPTASLILLAKFYDTSVDYIIGLTNEKKPYPKIH